MRTLLVYYSRTGTTKKVAESLVYALTAPQAPDVEQLHDTKDRHGPIGFLRAVADAVGRKIVPIERPALHPANYDVVVIGTPVWADTMSSAVRAYLGEFGPTIRRAALFCTTASSGIEDTTAEMAQMIDGEVVASGGFRAKLVKRDEHIGLMDEFLDRIREAVDV
ncbi:MAG: flavodoxin [Planctomycetes bacterium]|nr:flavodoxin [Phycisphaerae bacterium]NBB95809.1 flavodoxin [Planctomycetota bacterium]